MTRNVLNIGSYKYLIEHYNADDLKNYQYTAEFVMVRNYIIMNNIIYDTDIYIFEKSHLAEYIEELKSNINHGVKLAFPITDTNVNNYSDNYKRFNSNFNNDSIYNETDNTIGDDIYELKEIVINPITNKKSLQTKKIKCNKIRLYHPSIKKNINAIIDINNVINNIKFHYLCRPLSNYDTNSETEIKYNNESYSEFVELYYPNLEELFKQNIDGTYNVYYEEDFNIIASTRNEKFINSIMSDSEDIEHSEYIGENNNIQIVPLSLLIQPFRIIEEYAADSKLNYNDTVADDEKVFVKLYLKTNNSIDNNYFSFPVNINIYPYSDLDLYNSMYMLNNDLPQSTLSLHTENKFSLMSRLGFSDGIISIVSLFNYPDKSYFYNLYKNDETTSPVLEAYKYYYDVKVNDYNLFVNDDIQKEIDEIDNVDSISDDIIKTVKEIANVNYTNKEEILNTWKSIMKQTILEEYEEEFGTPGNFIGFKIEIATDYSFKNIIFNKNVRVNLSDLDDFSFKLNGIFESWNQRPEKLIVRTSFYDHIIGIEINSNLVIITKEWFKYLINNVNVHRLTFMSQINKEKGEIEDNMKVIELKEDNINFINNINCFINKSESAATINGINKNQRIILKPIFYKVKDLQNIAIRSTLPQNIGVNLSEYMTKVDTFKMIIENNEYVETGRNDIIVIFNINPADLKGTSGKYDITNEDGNYISSGNWTIV